ncbi:MAG: polysaccharide biosynthesis C-terminal domain-containing protein, partial [Limosilactobacillus sp.]
AILSTVFAEVVILFYQIYIIKSSKQLNIEKLFSGSIKYFFAGLIMFIVVFLLDRYLILSIWSITIEIALGVIIYVVLIFALKTEIAATIIDVLRKYNKGK